MPTYEYRCPQGHEFDAFQKMSDPPVAACPECGEEAERVLSGGAGLIFKGSGFYSTDYRDDSYKKAAEAEKKDGSAKADTSSGGGSKKDGGSSGDSKSTAKSESKPATGN